MNKQSVTVLGSTGSIGVSTLDVMRRHTDCYSVFALTASTQVDLILAQIQEHHPLFAVMASPIHASMLADKVKTLGLATQVLSGPKAICDVACDERVDSVMAAIVGAAGLPACMAAAKSGKKLMLANKEALVVGGVCFMEAVEQGGATLLPIDSEHSAIFQSLPDEKASWQRRVKKIVLTASGGPFRTRSADSLRDVTPAEACAHPNWVMGRKISVDSATMMNKALEVIEASFLFTIEPGNIEVVIHPQSVIHSMVQYRDTSIVAQLGTPDMRVPIAYGLSWPERIASGAEAIDFTTLPPLTFEPPDLSLFPGLPLAWQALRSAPGTTAVLNAANEVAVEAFLAGRIRFDQIHAVNFHTLNAVAPRNANSIDDLLAVDLEARQIAAEQARELAC